MEIRRRILLADEELAEMQHSISTVRSDLGRVESLANTVAAAWNRWPRMSRIAVALIGAALLVLFWSTRRDSGEDRSQR